VDALTALAAIASPLLVLAVLAVSVWKTARGLRTGGWRRPRWWVFPAVVLAAVGFVTWFVGIFSGGLDVAETCAERGYRYDDAYRSEHWREPSSWFPLHNKCDAEHDLVPAFVNPTLVAVVVLLLGCVAGAVAAAVIGRKKKRETRV
jgi:predicted PurR-regulated permease PerM